MTTRTSTMRASATTLDYYLSHPAGADGTAEATGLVIEEFVLAEDLSSVRLRGAAWSPADGGWSSSAASTRAMRTDPRLRARVTAVDRRGAEEAYRRLGGATLPDEDTLRGHFRDDVPLGTGTPLRLGAGPDVHRVLLAGEPGADRLVRLRELLRLDDPAEHDRTDPGVLGTGRLRVNDTTFRWDLRRIGGGAGWCIDVTAEPAAGDELRWLLRQLTDAARRHGLIPATIDRLS